MNRVRVSRLWETEQLMPAEKCFELENGGFAAAVIKSRNLAGRGDTLIITKPRLRKSKTYHCINVNTIKIIKLLNTKHSVPECGFEVLKTYQAPAHIWDLPR